MTAFEQGALKKVASNPRYLWLNPVKASKIVALLPPEAIKMKAKRKKLAVMPSQAVEPATSAPSDGTEETQATNEVVTSSQASVPVSEDLVAREESSVPSEQLTYYLNEWKATYPFNFTKLKYSCLLLIEAEAELNASDRHEFHLLAFPHDGYSKISKHRAIGNSRRLMAEDETLLPCSVNTDYELDQMDQFTYDEIKRQGMFNSQLSYRKALAFREKYDVIPPSKKGRKRKKPVNVISTKSAGAVLELEKSADETFQLAAPELEQLEIEAPEAEVTPIAAPDRPSIPTLRSEPDQKADEPADLASTPVLPATPDTLPTPSVPVQSNPFGKNSVDQLCLVLSAKTLRKYPSDIATIKQRLRELTAEFPFLAESDIFLRRDE